MRGDSRFCRLFFRRRCRGWFSRGHWRIGRGRYLYYCFCCLCCEDVSSNPGGLGIQFCLGGSARNQDHACQQTYQKKGYCLFHLRNLLESGVTSLRMGESAYQRRPPVVARFAAITQTPASGHARVHLGWRCVRQCLSSASGYLAKASCIALPTTVVLAQVQPSNQ